MLLDHHCKLGHVAGYSFITTNHDIRTEKMNGQQQTNKTVKVEMRKGPRVKRNTNSFSLFLGIYQDLHKTKSQLFTNGFGEYL